MIRELVSRQIMRVYEVATKRRVLSIMNELDRNQWLSKEELLNLQRKKLHNILSHAYKTVPYYQQLFKTHEFHPDEILEDTNAIRKLPVLTKDIIRKNFDDLLTTDEATRETLRELGTSGSTGQPLKFMQDSNSRDYFTAYVHHHLGWGGWKPGRPHAYIGGASFESAKKFSLRDFLMDWTFNRFATNAYALNTDSMTEFVDKIRAKRPMLLYGYASSIYHFAKFAKENNYNDIKFKSVFSSAEVMYPDQRQFIEETFDTQVYDRYATRELGELGSQDETQTGLRVSVENVFIEIVDEEGQPTPPGEAGNVIVTQLTNYGMPFIRYYLSDMAAWHPDTGKPAVSGQRAHPMLSIIEGRENDMFRARDGSIVWGGVNNALWNVDGVKQFQFIQKSYDLVIVKVVTENGLAIEHQNNVEKAIHTALGTDVEVKFEFPNEIPVDKSGKFRYQICEIPT